jgi:hypothetical protein
MLAYSLDGGSNWTPFANITSTDPANGSKSFETPPPGSNVYPVAQTIMFKADMYVFPPGSTSLPTMGSITVTYR